MSKSESDPKSRIELTDGPDEIVDKCKKAVTDFTSEVTFDPEGRPGVSNLLTIHSLLTGRLPEEICEECVFLDTGKYKLVIAEVIEENIRPIRERIEGLMADSQYLENVLKSGAEKASNIAEQTWQDVRQKVGIH